MSKRVTAFFNASVVVLGVLGLSLLVTHLEVQPDIIMLFFIGVVAWLGLFVAFGGIDVEGE